MTDSEKRRGPKLIGKSKRQRFNLSLDPETVKKGQKAAKEKGVSFSLWVEGLMVKALKAKR